MVTALADASLVTHTDSAALLASALDTLHQGQTTEVQENYKLLLCMAAGGLAPRGNTPTTPERVKAFETVLKSLENIALPGTQWIGRPRYLTDQILLELKHESDACKAASKLTDRYYLAKAGPVASAFATSEKLADHVERQFPGSRPTGIGSYIYYTALGEGLDPHVDTEIYMVNAILMLEHQYIDDPSHLIIYRSGSEPERVQLRYGEIAIINAGSVVHAREDMKAQENVHILTIGFA